MKIVIVCYPTFGGSGVVATELGLYLVKKGQKKQYAWNDKERDTIAEQFGGSVSVQRYKGLGEMNATQLWDTTMNPEFRTLRQVQIDNGTEADRIFSMLRKSFVNSTPSTIIVPLW